MEGRYLLWPNEKYDFYKIASEKDTVSVIWSHDFFEDYKRMANQLYICGLKTISEVLCNKTDNIKRDFWFLSGIYLIRHSIELGLKALICRISGKISEIQNEFKECSHDLSLLLCKYLDSEKEDFLTTEESEWLIKYFDSLKTVDRKSDVFRFPFEDGFLSKYANRILNIEKVANSLFQAHELVEKCLECDCFPGFYSFDSSIKPDFLIFSDTWYGCNLWQPTAEMGFSTKITACSDVGFFLFENKEIQNEDKFFPIAFMFRNAIELGLKMLFISKVDNGVTPQVFKSKRKKHTLKKDLWYNVKPMITEYLDDDECSDNTLETVESMINSVNSLDKKGDAFRYPTSFDLKYHFDNIKFDIKNICEYCCTLINYLEICYYMLDEAAANEM